LLLYILLRVVEEVLGLTSEDGRAHFRALVPPLLLQRELLLAELRLPTPVELGTDRCILPTEVEGRLGIGERRLLVLVVSVHELNVSHLNVRGAVVCLMVLLLKLLLLLLLKHQLLSDNATVALNLG
jgi:hypothetical protein